MSAKRNVLGQLLTPLNSARHSELVGFAVVLVTCSIAMIQLGHGQGAALATAAYIAACVVALYVAARLWTRNDRTAIVLIVVTAIAMRAPAFMQPPMLSHDAYRYVWDGKLVLGCPLTILVRTPRKLLASDAAAGERREPATCVARGADQLHDIRPGMKDPLSP